MQIIVSCTKGILNDSLETTNQILQRVLPTSFRSRLAYLSGPSFAAEVAGSQPSAVTIAAEDADVAHKVQKLLSTPRFRCYTTQDVAGGLRAACHGLCWGAACSPPHPVCVCQSRGRSLLTLCASMWRRGPCPIPELTLVWSVPGLLPHLSEHTKDAPDP